MRITSVNIPRNHVNNGLGKIKMKRLGQIVLLAGKNGSGKTRLLNTILQTMPTKPKKSQIDQANQNIELYKRNIQEQIAYREQQSSILSTVTDPQPKDLFERSIASCNKNIENYKREFDNCESLLKWDIIITDKLYEDYKIVPFVPKDLNLADYNNYRKNEILQFANSVDNVGIGGLTNGTFARIYMIQDKWFNATHQALNVPDEEKKQAIEEYERLKELIRIFLNTTLERNIAGEPLIFGFPLGQAKLSDGQKVLIQLCLAIHCQKSSLKDIILFLDEPENHLHPSVIIETIERIISEIPDGQIWIATHSIPLLAYFDPSSVWFIEDNKVSFAGNIPEKVLLSLLGNDDHISRLQDFISLPAIYALHRYAFESLFHPVSVATGIDDPQNLQIRQEIKRFLKDDSRLRILDYGSGKGRLLANIIENSKGTSSELLEFLDYVAYDKYDKDKDECLSVLKLVYPDADKRYFNSFSDLFTEYDRESFDIVIMCNVLHEIDPKDWLKLFTTNGEIPSLLSKNGILLVVEDHEMLTGEKAYQKGFLVLNTQEIKELFQIREADSDFGFSDVKGDGKLKAHRIPKQYLSRITTATRSSALNLLRKSALEKIQEIRAGEINYKNGKRHGFWVQQYANSSLALSELEGV